MINRTILTRIKNEQLRQSAAAIFDLADEVTSRRAALDRDNRFTAQGKAAEMSGALRTEIAGKLRELQQPVVRAILDVEQRTRALSLPAPDPANMAAALERQEIRAMLRAMPLAERSELVFKTKDSRITEAVLTAPCELSGFPPDRFEVLMNITREKLHGPAVAELKLLQADIDETRMCIEVATGEAQRASGIALDHFAKIIGNEKQGAPWLRKDGDRILVVQPGESTYPIANAADVATGRFYMSEAEYLADRPAGVRPVPPGNVGEVAAA